MTTNSKRELYQVTFTFLLVLITSTKISSFLLVLFIRIFWPVFIRSFSILRKIFNLNLKFAFFRKRDSKARFRR